jgi:hypothetical protein
MPRLQAFRHRPGNHCGSTSLRNLATFYDWGFSEETAFGLASGLGFTFFELPESPHRAFFGRPLFLEIAFFEHTGVGYEHRAGPDWPAVWATIRRQIDGWNPVMLFTDIYYLDYYGTDTHFAPHSLLAVGYEEGNEREDSDDAASGTVLLADSEFEEPQELPADRLRAALASEYSIPQPNRHLVVTDPTLGVERSTAMRRAIRETAAYMLDPGRIDYQLGPGTHGIAGIRAFAGELPEWVDLPDPGWTVRFASQNVERRGTGGGCFRRMYADFLATAGDEVAAVPDSAGERMADIADDWTAVGTTLKAASERDPDEMEPLLEEAARSLQNLADREEQLFSELQAALE